MEIVVGIILIVAVLALAFKVIKKTWKQTSWIRWGLLLAGIYSIFDKEHGLYAIAVLSFIWLVILMSEVEALFTLKSSRSGEPTTHTNNINGSSRECPAPDPRDLPASYRINDRGHSGIEVEILNRYGQCIHHETCYGKREDISVSVYGTGFSINNGGPFKPSTYVVNENGVLDRV